MGNLVTTIKRFISNKNTVTILAILADVIVLWYFYNYRVDQAITTISIPYAIDGIDSGHKIETDNIEYKQITKTTTKDSDIITNLSQIEGKYICVGTSIPKNGFFYESQICDKQELPNTVFDDIPDGYTIYTLSVNNQMTYANSIMPGNYIDLYMETTDDDNKILYGALIKSIEVLAVRDSSGKNVFWDSSAGDSAFLLFAVPDEYYDLLKLAEEINIDIWPVPRSASYSANPGETEISSQTLYNYIINHAAVIVD